MNYFIHQNSGLNKSQNKNVIKIVIQKQNFY